MNPSKILVALSNVATGNAGLHEANLLAALLTETLDVAISQTPGLPQQTLTEYETLRDHLLQTDFSLPPSPTQPIRYNAPETPYVISRYKDNPAGVSTFDGVLPMDPMDYQHAVEVVTDLNSLLTERQEKEGVRYFILQLDAVSDEEE